MILIISVCAKVHHVSIASRTCNTQCTVIENCEEAHFGDDDQYDAHRKVGRVCFHSICNLERA